MRKGAVRVTRQEPSLIDRAKGMDEADNIISRLRDRARRQDTPCGDGSVVWHEWGTGKPLLLLHGGSGSWTHWIRNIDSLVAAGFRVIVPDLPGSGDSALPPGGHDADAIPRWLESGLQQLKPPPEGMPVIGFSFGSLVAALFARDYPLRVASLILVGPPVMQYASALAIGLRSWRDPPPGPLRDAVHRHNLNAFMLAHPESVDELAILSHGRNVERDRLTKRRLSRTSLMRETLSALAQPIDVVLGELDVLYRGRLGEFESVLQTIPGIRSFTLLDQTGHWAPYESAERFNRLVIDLLSQRTSPC